MPADKVTHGTEVDESRVRTGPRHAAPRKPLFTRFHVPAGKAIAIAAMPTAVLMGMGLTPTLAQADDHSTAKSLTADEYQACVEAVTGADDKKDASESASPTPSASASESSGTATPTPSASSDAQDSTDSGKTSSPDSGSDDKAEPTPSASSSAPSTSDKSADSAATPAPTASKTKNPLDPLGIGDAIKDILTPDEKESATPAPSASASAGDEKGDGAGTTASPDDKSSSGTVKDTTDKVTDTVKDTLKDTTDTASEAAKDTTDAVKKAAEDAGVTPSPSASSTTDPKDCPVATDDEGGVDNPVTLPDDPWYLNASSLLLKGADYQGVVKVRTADGTVKKVLKYVISDGTDIGDLHQTVDDKQAGKTYHVQAAKGSTSTIRDGKTIMYTESISGNLLGLIPITFDPDNPPPLNIPLIYFTKVKVVQAGQFGGTLTIPGLHQYTTG
ncbi:hypothetical protein ACFWA4_37510 [Streptomyces sp. NPDC060011]|uniref:hypothetical protein n=1 Tax=unclassified Streptomyces TaxID=2593676 RepID=UPI0013B7836D|nr:MULTISPECIES: hypothetical protein [unclassified Streptomyces]MCX4917125.1 hypothetical protein [Streptomyces sp. NBC_00687]NEB30686.1 hypothetical protein [Streptomyces sp. SID14446]WSK61078.1 hypothetical protein OG458_14905 [Streptomyces sp. NBC_01281]